MKGSMKWRENFEGKHSSDRKVNLGEKGENKTFSLINMFGV
jgi:hypothetical protein